MATYKIDNSRISEYTKRNNNRVFKVMAIAITVTTFFIFANLMQQGEPPEVFYVMILSFAFTALILGLIYLNTKKLTKLTAENLQIIIDEISITRIIDLDKEPRMNILHKYSYNRAKHISGGFYTKIDFDKIKSIEFKNGDIWVKATNANILNGKNMLVIPRELANFNALEKEITATGAIIKQGN